MRDNQKIFWTFGLKHLPFFKIYLIFTFVLPFFSSCHESHLLKKYIDVPQLPYWLVKVNIDRLSYKALIANFELMFEVKHIFFIYLYLYKTIKNVILKKVKMKRNPVRFMFCCWSFKYIEYIQCVLGSNFPLKMKIFW